MKNWNSTISQLYQLFKNLLTSDLHKIRINESNPDFPVDHVKFDVDRKQYWKDRTMEVENIR